jgi:hypothetical protein
MGVHVSQQCRNHLKLLDAGRVTLSKSYIQKISSPEICTPLCWNVSGETLPEHDSNRLQTSLKDLRGPTTRIIIYSFLEEISPNYSMDQSPSWEASSSSAVQEIPRPLWNRMVHCRIHKSTPPVPILSQINPIRFSQPTSWRSILNIILPSAPRSPKRSPSLRFPYQTTAYTSPLHRTCYMPRQYQQKY